MDIVETSELGIRTVVLTLKRRASPMKFVLFPMLHVGSPEYYESVREQVALCDLVVAEGVGRTVASRLLTMSYRVVRFRSKSGLIVQNLKRDSFGIPYVHADMTALDFASGWRGLPWWQRAYLWCLIPPFALAMLVIGPRSYLARRPPLTDEPTLAELNAMAALPEFFELLLDKRDRILLDALADLHEKRNQENITVAVVYGARHIPAVVHGLSARYGYVVRTGEYLTIVDF